MKKIISIIVILIIVIGAIVFFTHRNRGNIPSSFNDKITEAHKAILLFNYKEANKLYAAAIRQEQNQAALEEYLAFLVSRENLNAAYKIAQKVLSVDPNHFLANLVNVAYLVKQNQLESAVNAMRGPSQDASSFNNSIYAILTTMNYFVEGQTAKYDSLATQIKQQLPDFYYNQVILYNLLTKNYSGAQAAAQEAVVKAPNIDNIILLAKLEYPTDKAKSIALFKEYLNDNFLTDKSAAIYLKARSDIDNISVADVLSDALFRFAGYASDKPSISYIDPDKILINHVALMLNPHNTLARIQGLSYYSQIGDYTTAMNNFNKIDQHDFYYRLVYPQIVDNLISFGKITEAVKLLQDTAKLDATDPQPLLELGHIYHKNKAYTSAIKAYSDALTIAKNNNQQFGIWLAYYFRGISYNTNNQWNLAEKDLVAALAINNKDPLLLNYLGYSWLTKGKDFNKAFAMIKTALNKAPNNPNILDSYAWALFMNKQYNEALKYALLAQKGLPFDASVNDHLGDIYWKIGKKDEAMNFWHSALNMQPDNDVKNNLTAKISGNMPSYLTANGK